MKAKAVVTLYRYYSYQVGYHNDELELPAISVQLQRFQVVRETAKGYWIHFHGMPKFVLSRGKYGRKRFAYETKELAWDSFLKRKKKWVEHAKRTLTLAQATWDFVKDKPIPKKDHYHPTD